MNSIASVCLQECGLQVVAFNTCTGRNRLKQGLPASGFGDGASTGHVLDSFPQVSMLKQRVGRRGWVVPGEPLGSPLACRGAEILACHYCPGFLPGRLSICQFPRAQF